MGAGKSTVGPVLAAILKFDFIDADKEIEKVAGMTIPDIFEKGEDGFRKLESRVIREITAKEKNVVALGGGALISSENRGRLTESGTMVYLKAPLDYLLKRIQAADRPMLRSEKDIKTHATELLTARVPHYEMAKITIEVERKEPQKIAEEIVKGLKE